MELMESFSIGLFIWQSVMIIAIILPIIALISILKSEFRGNDILIWVLVTLFLPLFGSILYVIIGRTNRLNK
jgi:hypothetical protein